MPIVVHRPPAPLDRAVEFLWLIIGGGADRQEAVVPSGTFEMVFDLLDEGVRIQDTPSSPGARRLGSAVVSGPYDRPFIIDGRQHAGMMGVHFRPGGAAAVLGIDANELRNAHVDLADLWGRAALDLGDRLRERPQERFAILEQALLGRLSRQRTRHVAMAHAVDSLLRAGPCVPMRELAAASGLSHKRFIDLFKRDVGLPPKLFARILRFEQARDRIAAGSPESWAAMAIDCGYYDQAHMINEFQSFAHATPAGLLQRTRDLSLKDGHLTVGH